jgi:hypothetical protein
MVVWLEDHGFLYNPCPYCNEIWWTNYEAC